MEKIEIALVDGTWLEGTRIRSEEDGVVTLTDVHRTKCDLIAAKQIPNYQGTPIAKRALVPWSAILFIKLEP